MAKPRKPCTEARATARRGLPRAYYQLHAVLKTVRSMRCYEDDLCTLLTQIERGGKVGSGVRREAANLLHSIPAMRLQTEMDGCFDALEEAAA